MLAVEQICVAVHYLLQNIRIILATTHARSVRNNLFLVRVKIIIHLKILLK